MNVYVGAINVLPVVKLGKKSMLIFETYLVNTVTYILQKKQGQFSGVQLFTSLLKILDFDAFISNKVQFFGSYRP